MASAPLVGFSSIPWSHYKALTSNHYLNLNVVLYLCGGLLTRLEILIISESLMILQRVILIKIVPFKKFFKTQIKQIYKLIIHLLIFFD